MSRVRTEYVTLALIDDTRRLRPIDPDWAAMMAEDVARGTELPPVVVRPAHQEEVREGCLYQLIIGGHRMEAHRLAGRTEIRADIVEMTRAEARIREVDENLIRHELNALDRAVMLRERKLAWEEAYPETVHGGDRKSLLAQAKIKSQTLRLDFGSRFSSDAVEKVGLSERTIQADIALAARLTPDAISLLRGTSLVDNAAELRRLANHDAHEQVSLAQALADGKARTVAEARIYRCLDVPVVLDAQEQIFAKVVDLLSRSTARTQRRALEHLAIKLGYDMAPRPAAKGAAK